MKIWCKDDGMWKPFKLNIVMRITSITFNKLMTISYL